MSKDSPKGLKQNPCPKCGSKNVSLVYADQQSSRRKRGWCNACGFYDPECNLTFRSAAESWNAFAQRPAPTPDACLRPNRPTDRR